LTNLRSDLGAANAKLIALTHEKEALEAEMEQLKHDLEVAREEQEDAPVNTKGKR
jgi:predicted  nucleic acid-binding Zn-ribbon protein